VGGYEPEGRVRVARVPDPAGQVHLFIRLQHGETADFTQVKMQTVSGAVRRMTREHGESAGRILRQRQALILCGFIFKIQRQVR
jgi:hypothetical protein